MKPIHVTDHAVIRYLERAKGFDIEAVRQHISDVCTLPSSAGALCVHAEGVKFELQNGKVITCTPGGSGFNRTKRARIAVAAAHARAKA